MEGLVDIWGMVDMVGMVGMVDMVVGDEDHPGLTGVVDGSEVAGEVGHTAGIRLVVQIVGMIGWRCNRDQWLIGILRVGPIKFLRLRKMSVHWFRTVVYIVNQFPN